MASNSFEELGMDNMTAILIEFNRKAHKQWWLLLFSKPITNYIIVLWVYSICNTFIIWNNIIYFVAMSDKDLEENAMPDDNEE